jgi:hypothetical protein
MIYFLCFLAGMAVMFLIGLCWAINAATNMRV